MNTLFGELYKMSGSDCSNERTMEPTIGGGNPMGHTTAQSGPESCTPRNTRTLGQPHSPSPNSLSTAWHNSTLEFQRFSDLRSLSPVVQQWPLLVIATTTVLLQRTSPPSSSKPCAKRTLLGTLAASLSGFNSAFWLLWVLNEPNEFSFSFKLSLKT